MEIIMNICKICKKETKNKVYCSVECQYEGYRNNITAIRIDCMCLYCNKEFKVKEHDIFLGRGKYCSRKCKDIHQKEVYMLDGNPMYGKHMSDDTKKIKSDIMKTIWENTDFREKFKNGIKKFVEKNGYFPGTDSVSNEKRKNTNSNIYGVDNIFKSKLFILDREDKCINRYGKHSWEIASDALFKKSITKPEIIVKDILDKNNIKYKRNFKLFYDVENLRYKIYDFLLKDKDILIEVDGDYWHSNPNFFNIQNETQIKNALNDEFKNKIAIQFNFKLFRFWENEIKQLDFKNKFMEIINEQN